MVDNYHKLFKLDEIAYFKKKNITLPILSFTCTWLLFSIRDVVDLI